MGVFTGQLNSADFVADLAAKSFSGSLVRYAPMGTAQLFALTALMKNETAVAVEHGFWSKSKVFPSVVLSAAVADATTDVFNVVSTANIIPNLLLQNPTTGENVLVNTVLSATQFTVVRGVGTAAAAAMADATALYCVGSAHEEGSHRPTALNITPTQIKNLTQIFRDSWALTDSARATAVVVGDDTLSESKADCGEQHATKIETALIFGQKSSGTRNGRPFRTMDGLISLVGNLAYYPASYSSANITTLGATTNYTQLETALDVTFNQTTDFKMANKRILYVGGVAKKVLNNIGRLNGQYQLVSGETTWGLQFDTFKLTRGEFTVIEHPLLNTNPTWAKMAICVDPSVVNVAYLGDRKTRAEEESEGGVDAVMGSLTTEMTFLCKNIPACAVLYNFTAAAAG